MDIQIRDGCVSPPHLCKRHLALEMMSYSRSISWVYRWSLSSCETHNEVVPRNGNRKPYNMWPSLLLLLESKAFPCRFGAKNGWGHPFHTIFSNQTKPKSWWNSVKNFLNFSICGLTQYPSISSHYATDFCFSLKARIFHHVQNPRPAEWSP